MKKTAIVLVCMLALAGIVSVAHAGDLPPPVDEVVLLLNEPDENVFFYSDVPAMLEPGPATIAERSEQADAAVPTTLWSANMASEVTAGIFNFGTMSSLTVHRPEVVRLWRKNAPDATFG